MTPQDLRRMSADSLELIYSTLSATQLPEGTFDGRAWLPGAPWLAGPIAWVWRGKLFSRAKVWNRMGRHLWIPGNVSLQHREVVIDYPQLRLQDRVRPLSPTLWLGRMQLGSMWVYFTLQQALE